MLILLIGNCIVNRAETAQTCYPDEPKNNKILIYMTPNYKIPRVIYPNMDASKSETTEPLITGRILTNLLFLFGAVALVSIVLQVVVRLILFPLFDMSPNWTRALAQLSFIWLTFIGIAIVSRDHDHVRIDMIINRCSERVQKLIFTIRMLLVIGFLTVFIHGSWGSIQNVAGKRVMSLPTYPPFTQEWKFIVPTVGCLLVILFNIRDLYSLVITGTSVTELRNDD